MYDFERDVPALNVFVVGWPCLDYLMLAAHMRERMEGGRHEWGTRERMHYIGILFAWSLVQRGREYIFPGRYVALTSQRKGMMDWRTALNLWIFDRIEETHVTSRGKGLVSVLGRQYIRERVFAPTETDSIPVYSATSA